MLKPDYCSPTDRAGNPSPLLVATGRPGYGKTLLLDSVRACNSQPHHSRGRTMNRNCITIAALAAAIALAAGSAFAAGTASTPEQVWQLSSHPQCYAVGDTVVVRGAVARDGSHAGVPGAVVQVQYGQAVKSGWTNVSGVYSVTFTRSAATDVRETSTTIPASIGTHVSVAAVSFGGSCSIVGAHVGDLQQVK